MSRIEDVTEAIIEASPEVVYKTMLDEIAGLSDSGAPTRVDKLDDGSPYGLNMTGEITIKHAYGPKNHIRFKVIKLVEGKSITVEFTGGDFTGTETYTFEPSDGKTRFVKKMDMSPNVLPLKLVPGFMIKKVYEDDMAREIDLLNKFVRQRSR